MPHPSSSESRHRSSLGNAPAGLAGTGLGSTRKWNWFWKGCKPNSVCPAAAGERIICLGGRYPEPVPQNGTRSGPLLGPLFGLAPDGVYRAPSITLGAVGSYPTISPLPRRSGAVYFLWHCPSSRLVASLPHISRLPGLCGIVPCGVRTFLPQLAPRAILHPPKTTGSIRGRSGKTSGGCCQGKRI